MCGVNLTEEHHMGSDGCKKYVFFFYNEVGIFTRSVGILHKEVRESFTRRCGNPSQGGVGILHKEVRNPSQGGVGILHK